MYKTTLSISSIITRIIEIVFSLVIFALFVRFLFRLLGANTESDIVKFVYNSTNALLAPFRNIFPTQVIEPGYLIEFSTLIAIVFYLLLAWMIVSFIGLFDRYTEERIQIVKKTKDEI